MKETISHFLVDSNKIIVAGKSLGSFVAYSIFQSNPHVKGLILMTPVCTYTTDDVGNTLPEAIDVWDENYPLITKDLRPIYITMGDNDDLCLSNVLFNHLKDSKRNIAVNISNGDHGLRIRHADGKVDEIKTQRNIEAVIESLLNWISVKL